MSYTGTRKTVFLSRDQSVSLSSHVTVPITFNQVQKHGVCRQSSSCLCGVLVKLEAVRPCHPPLMVISLFELRSLLLIQLIPHHLFNWPSPHGSTLKLKMSCFVLFSFILEHSPWCGPTAPPHPEAWCSEVHVAGVKCCVQYLAPPLLTSSSLRLPSETAACRTRWIWMKFQSRQVVCSMWWWRLLWWSRQRIRL